MKEVLAGLIAGLSMASVFIGLGAVLLISRPGILVALARLISPRFPPAALVPLLALVTPLAWTLVGMLLGLLYRAAALGLPGPGLGSSNGAFTLAMALLAVAASIPLAFSRGRGRMARLLINLAFAVIFGWLLPFFAA